MGLLQERDTVREGFLKDEDYSRLPIQASEIGLWLRTLLALYHNHGWRKAEAAAHLKVRQIDLRDRTILLSAAPPRTKSPKRFKMCQEGNELLSMSVETNLRRSLRLPARIACRRAVFQGRGISFCVHAGLGLMVCRRGGETAQDGRCSACQSPKLNYDRLLVHDLRRTAVRNLRRLSVAEKTIIEIIGHKTADVFRSLRHPGRA